MENLIGLDKHGLVSSLDLVKQINAFRKSEGKTERKHYDLLKVIKDELDQDERDGKISLSFYVRKTGNGSTRKYPMCFLTISQARRLLLRESKSVRSKIIALLDMLEAQNTARITPPLKIPTTMKEVLLIALEQQEKLEKLQNKLEEQKPAVVFANAVRASKDNILIGTLAKLLSQNGINIGQNRLFVWMRDNGYLIRREGQDYNKPTQVSINLGIMEIKERAVLNSAGVKLTFTTMITGKGQAYFVNKFLEAKDKEQGTLFVIGEDDK